MCFVWETRRKINLDFSLKNYYITIMKTMTTDIKFRKNDDGKFMVVIRGGRGTKIIQSKKLYNRKKEQAINYG